MIIARATAVITLFIALLGLNGGTAAADPANLSEPAIAQFSQVPNICNQQLSGADGPISHSGVEISGIAGADYHMHVEQQTASGWEPLGRGHLMAWVDGTLGDPEALVVPFGAQFRIFVIQSSGGTISGIWRVVVETVAVQGTSLGANLTPVASSIASC